MSSSTDMKAYWDRAASQGKANWHIAHIEDEDEFFASGAESVAKIYPGGPDAIAGDTFVLDIGCGKGRVSRALAKMRPDLRVMGLDVSSKMVEMAYKSAQGVPNVAYVVGDGVSLGVFPENLFDYVFSYVVFQHLPRHIVAQYITDAGRVLRPGGKLTFQVQGIKQMQEVDPPWNDYRKIRYYTEQQATSIVSAPLEVTQVRGSGHDMFVEALKQT